MYTIAWFGKRGGRHTIISDSLPHARRIAASARTLSKRYVCIIQDGRIIQEDGFNGTMRPPRVPFIELGD